ncbi:uncharacterized protein LOC122853405 [Aphidius gifuensis]|uniref:uncharacterized protein LOC122853405 n=1 Tax=Aphidius gifuensis TaxID=684658 RepID=UPI001CDB5341|nr:uncharacterized protein LOC122853405 [Aphidius gifuensis]
MRYIFSNHYIYVLLKFINMSNIQKFFLLFAMNIFIANGKLSQEIKDNIKFVCGEALIPGGQSGHLDGPGNFEVLISMEDASIVKNFTLEKPIKRQDNLTIEYGVFCGRIEHEFPSTPNICDVLESQSDDEKTNLYKVFIDLLGFSALSSCPIPAGTYELKQQNDYNPLLSDLFGSKCSETDKFYGGYGALSVNIIEVDYPIMIAEWHQIKVNNIDNCTLLGSVLSRTLYDILILGSAMS